VVQYKELFGCSEATATLKKKLHQRIDLKLYSKELSHTILDANLCAGGCTKNDHVLI